MLYADLYKQPFKFLFPDEKDTYRTLMGSFMTIFSVILVLVYAHFKLARLLDYQIYKIQDRFQEGEFTNTDRITAEDGFMIAAGIRSSAASDERDNVPPKEIGQLKFIRNYWTLETFGYDDIATRPCTQSDFDLGDD